MYLLLLQMAYNINGINSQINFTERNYLLSMKKLVIYRKKQFPSALMPYWIVTDISKSELMEKHQLSDDISCCYDKGGCPIYHEGFNPHEYGVPISIGKTLELEIDENIKSVFAVTLDGILSNELILDAPNTTYQILLTTVGGWKNPSYPRLAFRS